MADLPRASGSIEETADRLADLLAGRGGELRDPAESDLVFVDSLSLMPLTRLAAPADVWAVDGGQIQVADARCLQVYATRAARVRWQDGRAVAEEEGPLRAHLIGLGEDRSSLALLGAPVAADCPLDVNLLRDWAEWEMVAASLEEADPGAVLLLDGDLQPDWRISSAWFAMLMAAAEARQVTLVGVTKHTSLSWGGAPLLGELERIASEHLGARERWWVPIARSRSDVGTGIQVVVARLDPDARFSFRIDLPGHAEPGAVLGAVSALADDAAFPGYPYPLSMADRLAACPAWVRDEIWSLITERLDRSGVPEDVRERAFADRHRLMERY
jgi:hypothetical protein